MGRLCLDVKGCGAKIGESEATGDGMYFDAQGESYGPVVRECSQDGVRLADFTPQQLAARFHDAIMSLPIEARNLPHLRSSPASPANGLRCCDSESSFESAQSGGCSPVPSGSLAGADPEGAESLAAANAVRSTASAAPPPPTGLPPARPPLPSAPRQNDGRAAQMASGEPLPGPPLPPASLNHTAAGGARPPVPCLPPAPLPQSAVPPIQRSRSLPAPPLDSPVAPASEYGSEGEYMRDGAVGPGSQAGSACGSGVARGFGAGSGYGYGDGNGSGCEDGGGSGFGTGNGHGSGNGNGSGHGGGNGTGGGSGSGSGDGSGSGNGDAGVANSSLEREPSKEASTAQLAADKASKPEAAAPETKAAPTPPEKAPAAEKAKAAPPAPKALPPPVKGKGKGKPPPVAKAKTQAKAPEPRKPDVKPGVQVKRLFWNSFRLDDNDEAGGLWKQIDREGARLDTDELEALFADAPPSGMAGLRQQNAGQDQEETRKRTKIQVFENGRRRQICVAMARLPGKAVSIEAVLNMDTTRLNKDQIEILRLNLPSSEEVQLLRKTESETVMDEWTTWDAAEDFIIALIGIPQFQLRLQAWDFENNFQDKFDELSNLEIAISGAFSSVLDSAPLRHLLGIVLFLGNHLNGGTPRGRADGFAIDTLNQMRTVKMTQADRQGTLVDYIVRQMDRFYPGELAQMLGSGGEAENMRRASRLNLSEAMEDLSSFRSTLDMVARRVRQCAEDGDSAFAPHAEVLDGWQEQVVELNERFRRLQCRYDELCTWFHMKDRHSKKTSEEFFSIWDKFMQDMNKSKEAILEQERQEAKLEARRRNAILTPRAGTPRLSPGRISRRASVPALPSGNTMKDGKEAPSPRLLPRMPSSAVPKEADAGAADRVATSAALTASPRRRASAFPSSASAISVGSRS
eukprot:TRINITY_DN12656_c0_g2_i1.p1 TRINITY_DN12656_c0_g2~~TRINITY_DN12656_c0_g2_i1.p1  ORF type:complete len:1046 (+),score=252.68 TRINITY_DN12656_c0_g2_i1:395-3139(+)